jgi:tripartite-type tricarboxylate transporter receptor subunit TctC
VVRTKRLVLAISVALTVALVAAGCGGGGESGENYPSQPVEYVIPFDPGGESDTTARLQQSCLEEALGTSVSVSNQPGGGGSVGWSGLVNNIESTGYTIMGHNLPHIILQPLTREDAGYETDAINQVYIFESTPNALIVPEDSPYNTVEEFITAAQEDPGSISVGGSGEFTSNHVATLQLAQQTDVELQYVPFTGTGSATTALLSGQVDALMSYNTAAPDLQEQGARVLAVAAGERAKNLPDVPTFEEAGYELNEAAYRGAAVPPGTPDNAVNTLADAFQECNNDPEVIQQMEDLGFTIENMGPEAAEEFTQERLEENRQLLQELGLID